ncbi:MAG: hypothetical protein CL670_16225 [Balneola sp.]|nr:hypothetical protein [Balneola sp.]MBE80707.1 hypothetical protein [Balneola sp.]
MSKKRGTDRPISTTEVTKDLFSNVWKEHVDEVRTMAGKLQSEKLFSVTHKRKSGPIGQSKNPVRLSLFGSDE